jgi:hypothetical protein
VSVLPIEILRSLQSSEIEKQLMLRLTKLGNSNAGCNMDALSNNNGVAKRTAHFRGNQKKFEDDVVRVIIRF